MSAPTRRVDTPHEVAHTYSVNRVLNTMEATEAGDVEVPECIEVEEEKKEQRGHKQLTDVFLCIVGL